jgi:hypothetical protein
LILSVVAYSDDFRVDSAKAVHTALRRPTPITRNAAAGAAGSVYSRLTFVVAL